MMHYVTARRVINAKTVKVEAKDDSISTVKKDEKDVKDESLIVKEDVETVSSKEEVVEDISKTPSEDNKEIIKEESKPIEEVVKEETKPVVEEKKEEVKTEEVVDTPKVETAGETENN